MTAATTPHGCALRRGRFSEPDRIYIATSVTYARIPIFAELEIGRILVNAFRHQQDLGRASTLAYVVMPDHFHWLVQLAEQATLASIVHSVKSYTAHQINHARATVRRKVWQPGFHDHALRREEDLLATARYIVANPLRAGLVDDIREYPLWDTAWLSP
jgi:REP element-mobilizing transposase RayT